MSAAVLLIDPKFPHNVGNALRATACFGVGALRWTGERVPPPEQWPRGARLPREERIKAYKSVDFAHEPKATGDVDAWVARGYTPVAVEVRRSSEDLVEFVHPDRALYVFGPEDGSLERGVLGACHRFLRIPSNGCLNLAAAVNVVLYDRLAKAAVADRQYA